MVVVQDPFWFSAVALREALFRSPDGREAVVLPCLPDHAECTRPDASVTSANRPWPRL